MSIRTRELLSTYTRGMSSSDVTDAELARWRAEAQTHAEREWDCLNTITEAAERLAAEHPERADLLRRAIDPVWSRTREMARFGEPLDAELAGRMLLDAVDDLELQRRIGR